MPYSFKFSPPVPTRDKICDIEREFKIDFPTDYAEFILSIGGGSPDNPYFRSTGKRGKGIDHLLIYMYGCSDDYALWSAIPINRGFYETDEALSGYWIVGAVDEGHLILNCKENVMSVCDLNISCGIPDGGFTDFVMKPFSSFLTSLRPDPGGLWKPRNWLEDA